MKSPYHVMQPSTINLLMIKISILLMLCLSTVNFCLAQNGLKAEYYDGKDFNRFVSEQYVSNIENFWNDIPPVPGIDPHNCSIRWTGFLKPSETAVYNFSAFVDDGIRVWIDGDLIINQWDLNDVGQFSGSKSLIADQTYDIKVEYFNALYEGEIQLLWAIEKSKEDKSMYERIFGVEYEYKVIASNYFSPVKINEPISVPIAENTIPKPIKTKTQKKPASKPEPIKEPIKNTSNTIPNSKVPKPHVKELMTISKAKKYLPKNVEFKRATAEILPSSNSELNVFADFLLENPHISVTIEGHTDAVGVESQNQILSERRADKIAQYLILKGIDENRINTIGYGGSRPLKEPVPNEYYPPNRRVVFNLKGLE